MTVINLCLPAVQQAERLKSPTEAIFPKFRWDGVVESCLRTNMSVVKMLNWFRTTYHILTNKSTVVTFLNKNAYRH